MVRLLFRQGVALGMGIAISLGLPSIANAGMKREELVLKNKTDRAFSHACARYGSEAYCYNAISKLVAFRHMEQHARAYIFQAYSRLPKQDLNNWVSESDRRSQAMAELENIATEIGRYWQEHGRLPSPPPE